ncbi:MAG: hypothetical protein H0X26_04210 [Alphaproteobacteria bacterium]|nr:hypothetical protein [Alphaproteobacteria bacterium]
MKNYRRTLFLAAAASVISASVAQAGTLTVINKIPDQRVQLFIQGEGTDKHHIELVKENEQQDFDVNHTHTDGKNTFKVTASTGNGGSPDWKLMGGTCSGLVTRANHTLIIDQSALGKISCTNVSAENPNPVK